MKIYLAIKYYDNNSNQELITSVSNIIEAKGDICLVAVRDFEEWGMIKLAPKKLMKKISEGIKQSDAVLIELSQKGIGLGIVIGLAKAMHKPVLIIARCGTHISYTVLGVADKVIYYKNEQAISHAILEILKSS